MTEEQNGDDNTNWAKNYTQKLQPLHNTKLPRLDDLRYEMHVVAEGLICNSLFKAEILSATLNKKILLDKIQLDEDEIGDIMATKGDIINEIANHTLEIVTRMLFPFFDNKSGRKEMIKSLASELDSIYNFQDKPKANNSHEELEEDLDDYEQSKELEPSKKAVILAKAVISAMEKVAIKELPHIVPPIDLY